MKEGWEIKKLGDCFDSIKNGANIKQERGAAGIPITRIETLSGGVFNRDRLGYANILSLEKYASFVLDDGDLLLSHINSKTYIGRTVVYNKLDDEVIIHGMNLLRLKAIREILSPYYAYYCFKSELFKDQVASYRKDAVNQSSIPVSDLKKIKIPVPPIAEQEKIVAELDCLSGIIEKKKQQLKEYDALAQSIFYEMFGDPVENEKGLPIKQLGDITNSVNYGTSSPATENGRYAYLRMNNLTYNGYLDLIDLKYIDVPDKDLEKCIVRKGDILFNRTNSKELVGKTALFDLNEKMIIAGYIIRVRVNEHDVLPIYVVRYMNTPYMKSYFRALCKGAVNQANINSKELKAIPIPLPPLALQQAFASKIEAIEKQKELIKKTIEEVETLFNSRMEYYFN